jgi:hypothetical protein
MTEKIMIVTGNEIYTVDGTNMNLVKKFEVELHSYYELAKRVVERHEKESYDRIIVNTYTINHIGDELIKLFEQKNYEYDIKTGAVSKEEHKPTTHTGTFTGSLWYREEEF